MKRRIFSVVLIIAFIVVQLSGCQEEKESSGSRPATESAISSSEEKKTPSEPQYLYDQFINADAPDTSELGKDEGTEEGAKEVENDIKKIDKKIKSIDKQYQKNGTVEEGQVSSYL